MRLLVSVRNASEAAAALAGGADIIDAKEPLEGALGPVTSSVFREICETVGRGRPVSAALGDAGDGPSIEQAAREFAGAGAAFVKIGFADATRLDANLAAAVRGAGVACRVIGVAYVDANVDSGLVLDAIERANGKGMLLDTVNKTGPGLRQLISPSRLAHLVSRAHAAGLLMAGGGAPPAPPPPPPPPPAARARPRPVCSWRPPAHSPPTTWHSSLTREWMLPACAAPRALVDAAAG